MNDYVTHVEAMSKHCRESSAYTTESCRQLIEMLSQDTENGDIKWETKPYSNIFSAKLTDAGDGLYVEAEAYISSADKCSPDRMVGAYFIVGAPVFHEHDEQIPENFDWGHVVYPCRSWSPHVEFSISEEWANWSLVKEMFSKIRQKAEMTEEGKPWKSSTSA